MFPLKALVDDSSVSPAPHLVPRTFFAPNVTKQAGRQGPESGKLLVSVSHVVALPDECVCVRVIVRLWPVCEGRSPRFTSGLSCSVAQPNPGDPFLAGDSRAEVRNFPRPR